MTYTRVIYIVICCYFDALDERWNRVAWSCLYWYHHIDDSIGEVVMG